jgi:dipeptidase D
MPSDPTEVLHNNLAVIEPFTPKRVWDLFARLACVPRGSANEDRVQRWFKEWLEEKGISVTADDVFNLVARFPASAGREQAPGVVLQAHVDMVCVREPASDHDFELEAIRFVADERDGERIVRANGTTLGADNGLGVSMALAAGLDPEVMHGPLEVLLTVNEEAGMTGAKAITDQLITGRILLNLDTEEDDQFYIGCAGAETIYGYWEPAVTVLEGEPLLLQVTVGGLKGGHSGMEIDQGRGNAIKIAADVLATLPEGEFQLVKWSGGTARNAIPDRSSFLIAVASEETVDRVRETASTVEATWRAKLAAFDPGLKIEVKLKEDVTTDRALTPTGHEALLAAVRTIEHGVHAMNENDPALVQTSTNVAVLHYAADSFGASARFTLEVSCRSLDVAELKARARLVETVIKESGDKASAERIHSYPPWKPNFDSALVKTCVGVYEELFGGAPAVKTIHAGLECGLIAERVPGVDMISLGPRIEEPHTPMERAFVASVEKSWKLLVALLDRLSKQGT